MCSGGDDIFFLPSAGVPKVYPVPQFPPDVAQWLEMEENKLTKIIKMSVYELYDASKTFKLTRGGIDMAFLQ